MHVGFTGHHQYFFLLLYAQNVLILPGLSQQRGHRVRGLGIDNSISLYCGQVVRREYICIWERLVLPRIWQHQEPGKISGILFMTAVAMFMVSTSRKVLNRGKVNMGA